MLALGVRKNHVIQIGENSLYGIRSQYLLSIMALHSYDDILIDRTGPDGTVSFSLSTSQMTEVLPNVKVCCGPRAGTPTGVANPEYAKIVIDAPKSIPIIRLGNLEEEYARLHKLP